ncbi:hemolysin family protein [Mycoplasmopsis caviae]|uniref:Hemolysin family protein n=1 Tax=Mycoplasmopsis caviae TaxID=55603 RepID=A0A3P8LAE8_9BACT|nr:hemolysin family protein [Mycoplasmopsis caviae]UUD35556.1 hemolysin family protein [Mycoplasmopsis caviae]VDR41671.1 magnesium/cobalt efflux protein CorC [Mycoplasmopsis caviae]VDR42590.1 magnesium/cobalt efflux protein CorC [Mycoplasmopsis caviae]
MESRLKLIFSILGLVFLLISSSIFSASETAYTSLNAGKVETMVENKEFGHKIIKKQHTFFNQTLGTILICNNIVNIAASALTSWLLSSSLGEKFESYNVLISTAVMTPIIVIFGEIIPKLIAKSKPEMTVKTFCYVLIVLYYLFWPITFPISKIGKKIYITNTENDVKNIIDIAQNEGVLEANESLMAQNALDLDSTKVRKHYIRIKDVSTIDSNASIQDALEIFKDTNYSRIPVKKDEHLIGILHLKDIFFLQKGKVINYFKPIPTISANSSLSSAIEKMRYERAQMSFVTPNNNSGEIIGIITIEDILEEIVGEIYDEFDDEELKDIFEISLEHFHVSASLTMKELTKKLEIDLNLDEAELELSLHKWLEKRIGHKLFKNSKYEFNNVYFKVISLGDNKFKNVRVDIELGNKVEVLDTDETQVESRKSE